MGELLGQACVGIVRSRCVGARLVGASSVILLRLGSVLRLVLILTVEISLARVLSVAIGLLLRVATALLRLGGLWGKDGLGKGRGGGWVCAIVWEGHPLLVAVEVELQPLTRIHDVVCDVNVGLDIKSLTR